MKAAHQNNRPTGLHVVVVGCGNIGSHLVPHLARMPEVGWVTLIDRDVYTPDNIEGQDIVAGDVDKPKAEVQAARLRRINPRLDARPVVDGVENLPLVLLRGDVILAGLDSKLARQVVNEKAWQLGCPLIDAGVDGPGMLARVSVYRPGPDAPCLQCFWTEADYRTVEQVFPCAGGGDGTAAGGVGSPPTGAPSALGALAGALQAIECRKLLAGETGEDDGEGREILIDARYGNLYVTSLERDPDCRMREHRFDPVIAGPTCTVETEIGRLVGRPTAAEGETAAGGFRLRVLGQPFVTRLTCPDCGRRRDFVRLKPSLRRYWCWNCHGEMLAAGFDTRDELVVGELPRRMLGRTLESVGVRAGDVVAVGDAGGEKKVVVGGECAGHGAPIPPGPVAENNHKPRRHD
jgi:molybdopterin/thiamine biosynthesis adenylyltransferase